MFRNGQIRFSLKKSLMRILRSMGIRSLKTLFWVSFVALALCVRCSPKTGQLDKV